MENFNFEGHKKLWMLLAENIHVAARENYTGNGYYNAYGALERLKKEILLNHFPTEERNPKNYCFACDAAWLYQEMNWLENDELHCEYCPLQWPEGRGCEERNSLYCQLVCYLDNNEITRAAAICIEIANVPYYTEEEVWKRVSEERDCYEF